jgi:hypothetical protein
MPQNVIVNYRSLERAIGQLEHFRTGQASVGLESKVDGRIDDATTWLQIHRALRTMESDGGDAKALTTSRDALTSLLQSYLAEQAGNNNQVDSLPTGGYEAKFDTRDLLGWVGSFFTWWRRLRPHEWRIGPSKPSRISNHARIGLLSDWGTGLYGAPVCAETIRRDSVGFDYLMHLGDVYYSGTKHEIRTRFFPDWPMVAREAHFALNSNHEMYSGGHGYFDEMLPELAKHSKILKQNASYFALENDYFVLVALDTGYVEHDLAGDQATWLHKIVADAHGKKIILFSHHQPFSLFEDQGTKLIARLNDLLKRQEIFAWYWGHEHRLVIYDKHADWNVIGRCIGHGGMPYFRDKFKGTSDNRTTLNQVEGRCQDNASIPGGQVLDGPNPYISGHEAEYGPNGFAILELSDSSLIESHRLPDGSVIYQGEVA